MLKDLWYAIVGRKETPSVPPVIGAVYRNKERDDSNPFIKNDDGSIRAQVKDVLNGWVNYKVITPNGSFTTKR